MDLSSAPLVNDADHWKSMYQQAREQLETLTKEYNALHARYDEVTRITIRRTYREPALSVDPRAPYTAPAQRLPPEVTSTILIFAVPPIQFLNPAGAGSIHSSWRAGVGLIRSLVLVCRAWNGPVTAMLYRDVALDSTEQIWMLLRTLQSTPALGYLVRSLRFLSLVAGIPRQVVRYACRIILLCPALNGISLMPRSDFMLPYLINADFKLNCLTHLEFGWSAETMVPLGSEDEPNPWLPTRADVLAAEHMLSQCKALEFLKIGGYPKLAEAVNYTVVLENVRTFVYASPLIRHGMVYPSAGYGNIHLSTLPPRHWHLPRLAYFKFSSHDSNVRSWLMANDHGATVETLELGDERHPFPGASLANDLLGTCPRLKHLILRSTPPSEPLSIRHSSVTWIDIWSLSDAKNRKRRRSFRALFRAEDLPAWNCCIRWLDADLDVVDCLPILLHPSVHAQLSEDSSRELYHTILNSTLLETSSEVSIRTREPRWPSESHLVDTNYLSDESDYSSDIGSSELTDTDSEEEEDDVGENETASEDYISDVYTDELGSEYTEEEDFPDDSIAGRR